MDGEIKPTARKDGIVVQKIGEETLVYDLNENKALCLNETSALVWELCDGRRTTLEIGDEVGKKLKSEVSEDLVCLALDQLSEDLLIDDADSDYFGGLSRREAIRKVGFASVVSLPLISSLAAPKAVNSQSCGVLGFSCSGNAACCSGNCATFITTMRCCVPGATGTILQGGAYACGTTQADCDAAQSSCCSNSGTLSAIQGGCLPGQFQCRCDRFL